jgi:hypothetical protein
MAGQLCKVTYPCTAGGGNLSFMHLFLIGDYFNKLMSNAEGSSKMTVLFSG